MKSSRFFFRLKYYLQFFPFTANAVVIIIALWIAYHLIGLSKTNGKDEDISAFAPMVILMGKIALGLLVALLAFSVLSTFLCWLHYLWLQKKYRYRLEIDFINSKNKKGIYIESFLKKARRPFLGFIKGRFCYDNLSMTDKFVLSSDKRNAKNFWREGVKGKSFLELPDIKEYSLQKGVVFFEDMFQIFSLPVLQPVQGHFYQAPHSTELQKKEIVPKKTEEAEFRINELRRVSGEWLNYKTFESGDDVRRIVWKVYAKSRELVVRTPEIMNPYASHIYLYASFHTDIALIQAFSDYGKEMLNYYKNKLWAIFSLLQSKDLDVRYVSENKISSEDSNTEKIQKIQRLIATAQWQQEKKLIHYFRSQDASVLCISSFNKLEDIAEALEGCNKDTVVYFIRLSKTFKHVLFFPWLIRLFVLPPKDRLKRIRSKWILSPMRYKIVKKEKTIIDMLKKSRITVGEI